MKVDADGNDDVSGSADCARGNTRNSPFDRMSR